MIIVVGWEVGSQRVYNTEYLNHSQKIQTSFFI